MSLERPAGTIFRFGEMEVDVARRELRRRHVRVPLQRKPFDLMLLLLRNRERTVSHDELRAQIWPGIRVSDATISSTLRDLRRALGDSGETSLCIRTMRRVGLRFVLPVQELATGREDIFVGREAILARLRDALAASRAGRGRIVLLAGEPGIGKSRTAEEFTACARDAGFAVHVGRCRESRARPPYGPWVQLLTSIVEAPPGRGDAALLEGIDADVARIAPALGAPREVARSETQEEAVYRLFDAIATLLRRAMRREPLVLILEDLDRADRSSIDLLEFVGSAFPGAPLLLLGTYRTSAVDAEHALVRALETLSCERHELGRLTRSEVAEFTRRAAGVEPTPEEVAALHQRSAGIPLFLRELVWFAVERATASGAALHAELGATGTPPSLREWIRGRLLGLAPVTRRVLEVAALLGREFRPELVARAAQLAADEVLDALEDAARAGFVGFLPIGEWSFVHALVPELIEADLGALRRGQLHQRIGQVLRSDGSDEAGARWSEVAGHLLEAADRIGREAAEALARAGEHAERRLAFADACDFYAQALELRADVEPGDSERTCDLLLALSRSRLAVRRVHSAWECAGRALEMARRIESAERMALAVLVLCEHVTVERAAAVFALLEEALRALPAGALALRARVLSAMSMQLHYAWQPERRLAYAERALRTARESRDPDVVSGALAERRNALCGPHLLPERLRVLDELVTLADCLTGSRQRAAARAWRAVDRLNAGDLEAAELDVAEVARIAREEGFPRFLGFPRWWSAMRALGEGRFTEAEEAARDAVVLMRRADDPNAQPYFGVQIGSLYYEQGRWPELGRLLASSHTWLDPHRRSMPLACAMLLFLDLLEERAEPALRDYERLAAHGFAVLEGDPDGLATASWLACAVARLGDAERAEQLLGRLRSFGRCQTVGSLGLCNRGALARYLGLLAQTAGRLDESKRHFEEAIESNRKLGLVLYEARAQRDLAALLAAEPGGAGEFARSELLARAAEASFEQLDVAAIARAPGL